MDITAHPVLRPRSSASFEIHLHLLHSHVCHLSVHLASCIRYNKNLEKEY